MGFVKTFSAVQKIYFAQFETCIPCSVTWQSGFTFFLKQHSVDYRSGFFNFIEQAARKLLFWILYNKPWNFV